MVLCTIELFYYLKVRYTIEKKQSIKSGDNSKNIQINGDFSGNDVNIA